jgi:lipopolysaccharide transport protein LptA
MGSVAASRIVLKQDTGDFTAENQVRSSRLMDRKKTDGGGMLAADQPSQGTADRMVSANNNQRILYEGKAVLWQSGSRLQADRVLIDRQIQGLQANGSVVSQFVDQPAPNAKGKKKEPSHTTVRAASLDYSEKEKLAWYRGGVRLIRDRMDVKSGELRAWLAAEGKEGESKLDRAFADGDVEIVQADPGRTRRGSAEHAEYYVGEEKVVLYGGHPQMIDSVKGTTRGQKLTYWADNDRFQGDGVPTQPAVSRIKRK